MTDLEKLKAKRDAAFAATLDIVREIARAVLKETAA